MLNKQRRVRPLFNKAIKAGKRVVRERFGVDRGHLHRRPRLHPPVGLPFAVGQADQRSAADDPVAHDRQELRRMRQLRRGREAAVLCPSFYRAEIVHNPDACDRWIESARAAVIGWFEERRLRGRVRIAPEAA